MTTPQATPTPAVPPFHLAFPVHDIAVARAFYGQLPGCPEGRSSDQWVDFNFYEHQIVAHLAPDECNMTQTGVVDGHTVAVRHFGAVLSLPSGKPWPTSRLQQAPNL